eukprot:Gb_05159 [translate_table: standard]
MAAPPNNRLKTIMHSEAPFARGKGIRRLFSQGFDDQEKNPNELSLPKRIKTLTDNNVRHDFLCENVLRSRGLLSRSPTRKLDILPPHSPLLRRLQGPQRVLQQMGTPAKNHSITKHDCGDKILDEHYQTLYSYRDTHEKDYIEGWKLSNLDEGGSVDLIENSRTFQYLDNCRIRVSALKEKFSSRETNPYLKRTSNNELARNGRQDQRPSSSSAAVNLTKPAHNGLNLTAIGNAAGKDNNEKIINIVGGDNNKAIKQKTVVPLYLVLHEKAKERDVKLRALQLEVELTTAKLAALQVSKKELFQTKEKENVASVTFKMSSFSSNDAVVFSGFLGESNEILDSVKKRKKFTMLYMAGIGEKFWLLALLVLMPPNIGLTVEKSFRTALPMLNACLALTGNKSVPRVVKGEGKQRPQEILEMSLL